MQEVPVIKHEAAREAVVSEPIVKGGIKVNERKLSPLGKVIKKRLIDINKSQIWLAEKVGMNEKYLHLVLYGERSGKKYLPDIINVLGLDPELLQKIA